MSEEISLRKTCSQCNETLKGTSYTLYFCKECKIQLSDLKEKLREAEETIETFVKFDLPSIKEDRNSIKADRDRLKDEFENFLKESNGE